MVNFLRKNWFWIGLASIAVWAVYSKTINISFGGKPIGQPEKYTDAGTKTDALHLFNSANGKHALPEIDENAAIAFLKRFGKVTRGEREKFGVSAAALLACAYINSHAGARDLTRETNNFFALGCGGDWEGPSAQVDSQCFRRYDSPWHSFRDFSAALAATPWAKKQLADENADWKIWVALMAKNNCSDVKDAEAHMTAVIKKYRLFELDEPAN